MTSSQNKASSIAIIVYSAFGHVSVLASQIEEGIRKTGASCQVFQFEETLSDEILVKIKANKTSTSGLPIITPEKLVEFDGMLLGFPTRCGRSPAQVSAFFDSTGGLWRRNALLGKFGGVFTAASVQHGGIETTCLTTVPFFSHMGIIFVPRRTIQSSYSLTKS